ncbi:triple tyrosine motif-containing protein [Peribacillus glennii]|uniref:L,D-TPase catalytic domain-containing protein n=1 Tax=Peribacillus glennii TaxID=2303991 RepID=A0A372LC01_9BACI|nr:triple tyrosine motif-containing protein [Peribacillus glennii]RFU62453.1 hypothetical protein D0466_14890 [Peribacillus glennii]
MKKFATVLILLVSFIFFTVPEAHATSTGQLIIVNKATNRLAFFDGGKLVKTFKVATGRQRSYTPEGKFPIVKKIKNRPYYSGGIPGGHPNNPLGDRWLGLDARGTYGTTYAIHGNNKPSSIGTYASSGCIRMYDSDVRWLYDQVKTYTPVIITHTSKSFESIAVSDGYVVESKIKSFTASKKSPQLKNTTVKLSASTSQGYQPAYKFSVYYGKKWTTIKNYSSSKSVNWKPTRPGAYKLKVSVKSKYSRKTADQEKVISYNIFESASLKSVKTDKASPQLKGSNIAVSAASNNNANNRFRYLVYDGNTKKWTTIKNYSTATKVNWKPAKTGQYKIKVQAKHKWSKKAYDHEKSISYNVFESAVLKSISTNKKGPQPVNTDIAITAASTKNSDHVFRLLIIKDKKTVHSSKFSAASKFNWTPKTPGNYTIKVQVKHKWSKKAYDHEKTLNYTVYQPAATPTVTFDKEGPQPVNTAISVSAASKENKDYEYRFSILKDGKWTVVQLFSKTYTYSWTPDAPGNYKIKVEAKHKLSKLVNAVKEIDYEIVPAVEQPADPVVEEPIAQAQ